MGSDSARLIARSARTFRDPEERRAYLDRVCRGTVALRTEVERLLAEDDPSSTARAADEDAAAARPPSPTEKAGDVIGRYTLVEPIGEGGFGTVWMAEQFEPVRRRVALKIIKLGMNTQQVVARFGQERQALAMMDHPNVARVLDAGATAAGRPYFVMDLVQGVPIHEYCDRERLTIDARLDLFAQVCTAVQHAHTKGIIHRDLKPSNVLVAARDGRPHATVIDFGIAKATSADLATGSQLTEQYQIIGTLQYMSPEQAQGSLDIDTRTDVYSLGVLLYELLTGTTPFDEDTLRHAMFAELQRMIREVDPPRPSARITESRELLPQLAATRRTEPARLRSLVRGELDWIAMRALEKDRLRRYQSAADLAADVRRRLAGDAVLAAPPSRAYRVRKFVRRHRTGVVAGTAVAASLVVGVVAFAWQAAVARGRLYDSLVREATVVRQNRQLGYRGVCFDRLRQAAALSTANRDFARLQDAASQCLGDPLGLDPVELPGSWEDLPSSRSGLRPCAFHRSGKWVARVSGAGGVTVFQLAESVFQSDLAGPGKVLEVLFGASPQRLFGIVEPHEPDGGGRRLVEWRRDEAGAWALQDPPIAQGVSNTVAAGDAVIVAVGRPDGSFGMIDVETGARVGDAPAMPLAIDAARARVVTRADDRNAVLVRSLPGAGDPVRVDPGLSVVRGALFDDDGGHLVVACQTGLAIYDTARLADHSTILGYLGQPAFLDRTTLLVPLPQEGMVRLFDLAAQADSARLAMPASHVQVARDRCAVLAVEDDARVVRLGATSERVRLVGHLGGVPAVEFSPDGTRLVSIGKDSTLRLWDAASGAEIRDARRTCVVGQAVAFRPDGRLLVSGEWNSTQVRLWSVESREPLLTLPGPDASVACTFAACFSPDGRRVAAATVGGLRAWELAPLPDGAAPSLQAREIRTVPDGMVQAIQFDDSGEWIAYVLGADDGTWGTWEIHLDDAARPHRAIEAYGSIQCLGFSRRYGTFVGASRRSQGVELWTPGAPGTTRTIPAYFAGEVLVECKLAVSPDGTRVALTSPSGRGVIVLDLGTGRRLHTLPDESSTIWWLAWSPDGTRIAVARPDGDISIWSLPAAESVLAEAGLLDPERDGRR